MKRVFIWLFVINVVVAVVMALREIEAKGESARIQQQLFPEKIKLLGQPPAVSGAIPPPSAPAPEPSVCLEWGGVKAADAGRAQAALASVQLGAKTEKREEEQIAGYWVYIPPIESKQEALAKLEQVRRLGIVDSFLILDGSKWRNAISLGTFRAEQAAKRHLEELRRRGVDQAIIGPRLQTTGYVFVIREVSSAQQDELAKRQQEFPDSQLRPVNCG
jgi:hypothetical protein